MTDVLIRRDKDTDITEEEYLRTQKKEPYSSLEESTS
jgi:hypothetical protein